MTLLYREFYANLIVLRFIKVRLTPRSIKTDELDVFAYANLTLIKMIKHQEKC
jgi:hypothetical protein